MHCHFGRFSARVDERLALFMYQRMFVIKIYF